MARYNRNYGKLDENKKLTYAPIPLVIDGKNVWTNIGEKYIDEGFYPIERTSEPVKEGFYYTPSYEILNDKIIQNWDEHEDIPEEPSAELLDIVSGEVKV